MKKHGILILIVLTISGLVIAAPQTPNTLSDKEKAQGWQLLFNGTSLEGWRGYRQTGVPAAGWKIEEGLLKTVPKVKGSELITVQKYNDFELSWEWNISIGGNNGLKYFVTEDRPGAPGHEYQMIDDERNPDGKVSPKRTTASFYDVLPPTKTQPMKPAGQWNSSRIVVQGNRVEHWLNGEKALEYELGSERVKAGLAESKFNKFPDFGTKIQGHIMLTYHNDECAYRNIKIREIRAK